MGGAHPHVCGEHLQEGIQKSGGAGSSPRMRGTPVHNASCGLVTGLIPTYAGNTLTHKLVFLHERAHPHVCGEH